MSNHISPSIRAMFSHYAPEVSPDPPASPVCTRSKECNGCPYPTHGFICWNADGSCLRTRVRELEEKHHDSRNTQ